MNLCVCAIAETIFSVDWRLLVEEHIAIIGTRRYGPLRTPTSSSRGGLQPSADAFFALRSKKEPIILFWPIFVNFWCPVVTLVTLSSNLSNFERNPKNPKKIQRKGKNKK